jgi:hypothetical protein
MKMIWNKRANCGVLFTVTEPGIKAVGDGEIEVKGKPSAFYEDWFGDFKLQACMPGHCRLHFLVRLLRKVTKVAESFGRGFLFACGEDRMDFLPHSLKIH